MAALAAGNAVNLAIALRADADAINDAPRVVTNCLRFIVLLFSFSGCHWSCCAVDFPRSVEGLLTQTALPLSPSDRKIPRALFSIPAVQPEPPAVCRQAKRWRMKSNPSQVATSVSINQNAEAPFAGAEIDPAMAAFALARPSLLNFRRFLGFQRIVM